jgi:hypothetical protein
MRKWVRRHFNVEINPTARGSRFFVGPDGMLLSALGALHGGVATRHGRIAVHPGRPALRALPGARAQETA